MNNVNYHPSRIADEPVYELIRDQLGKDILDAFSVSLANRQNSIEDVLQKISQRNAFKRWRTEVGFRNDHVEALMETLAAQVRLRACNGRVFSVTEHLDALLSNTDIGKQAPAHLFRLPYPCIYFHFGGFAGGVSPVGNDPEWGEVFIEGVYVTELIDQNVTSNEKDILDSSYDASMRCYEISVVVSDKKGGDFPLLPCNIYIPSNLENSPLEDVVERNIRLAQEEPGEVSADRKYAVYHLAKVLLYLLSEAVILEEENEADKVAVKLSTAKGKGKLAKLKKRLNRTYNKVIVGPKASPDSQCLSLNSNRKVSAHWRRGHFRWQAFGEGLQERKLIWIKPTLVGLKDNEFPPTKDYEIR